MSAFCPASEVILRHADEFITRRVLFSGDIPDDLPCQFNAAEVRVHCSQYYQWQQLSPVLNDKAQYNLLPTAVFFANCDTLIYYWPKSKQEAQFQLESLLSSAPLGSELFVVGENRSGVRSAEAMLSHYGIISKIDRARRCSLFHFRLEKHPIFNLKPWWGSYQVGDVTIKTLPGIFSRDGIDIGSELLLSTITNAKGTMLDIGCGAGVLSAVLAQRFPELTITLADVSAAAIEASKATLLANSLSGKVISSNLFSDIHDRYNLIISNPPFHQGVKTNYTTAESLIHHAKNHLQLGGRLIIVANAFLPYPALLKAIFGDYELLANTGRFNVYQAVLQHPTTSLNKTIKYDKKPQ